MVRIVLSALAGLVAWLILWFGIEAILSAIGPDWYGVHQRAFETALIEGGQFTADTTLLLIQLVLAASVSFAAGFMAVLFAGDNHKASKILGFLLIVLGLMKVVMSWPYVPIWHHVIFLALLFPLAVIGGRVKSARKQNTAA